MAIQLPRELRAYVKAKVASGMYGDESEVVSEAIRNSIDREEMMLHALLGEAWAEAERGELQEVDLDAEFEAAVKRYEARQKKKVK